VYSTYFRFAVLLYVTETIATAQKTVEVMKNNRRSVHKTQPSQNVLYGKL
jgi:hypothetical protein